MIHQHYFLMCNQSVFYAIKPGEKLIVFLLLLSIFPRIMIFFFWFVTCPKYMLLFADHGLKGTVSFYSGPRLIDWIGLETISHNLKVSIVFLCSLSMPVFQWHALPLENVHFILLFAVSEIFLSYSMWSYLNLSLFSLIEFISS